MNPRMTDVLRDAFQNPDRKNCFFIGESQQRASDILGISQWDWSPQPVATIEPWFWQTHTIALAFGAKPLFTSDGKEWIEKLITDPSQVSSIKVPDVWSSRTGEMLDKAVEMLKQLPEDTLIRMPDIQSPLGVAELLWDESFYMAFLLNPDALHELLDKITDFNIAYVRELQNVLGKRFNPACHPRIWSDPAGYYISDDVNSMISPDLHAEFSIPYINRMTEACGPVFYHSCTWREEYFENIRNVKNKKMINWSTGSSIDPAVLIKEFSGESVIAPHIGIDTHTEGIIPRLKTKIADAFDLVNYYLDSMQDNTTMYMVIQESIFTDAELTKRIYRLFDERGYTPKDI